MNRFVKAITSLDISGVSDLIKEKRWSSWTEPSGKNALHYLCGIEVSSSPDKATLSLKLLKLLLRSGLDIDSIHRIEEKNCEYFPATPLWYAYARGRNEKLYRYLLRNGADPSNCWWAIVWFDDVEAADLWLANGAKIAVKPALDDLFLGAIQWKKLSIAKWMLDQGANVNARGPFGMTAIMLAVKRKDEDAIRTLREYDADPDIADDKGMSARSIAAERGPKRILSLLG